MFCGSFNWLVAFVKRNPELLQVYPESACCSCSFVNGDFQPTNKTHICMLFIYAVSYTLECSSSRCLVVTHGLMNAMHINLPHEINFNRTGTSNTNVDIFLLSLAFGTTYTTHRWRQRMAIRIVHKILSTSWPAKVSIPTIQQTASSTSIVRRERFSYWKWV